MGAALPTAHPCDPLPPGVHLLLFQRWVNVGRPRVDGPVVYSELFFVFFKSTKTDDQCKKIRPLQDGQKLPNGAQIKSP